ncbi:MAG: hypothetical protein ABI690_25915 [Chloroflexota bacterium]
MKKRIVIPLLLMGCLTIWGVVPTFAQSTVDPQLLNTLKTAFDNTKAATSMTVSVDATTVRDGQTDTTPARTETDALQMAANATGWDVSGSRTTVSNVPANAANNTAAATQTTTTEFIVVDGKTYIRFTAIPDSMTQQNLPKDWVAADQLGRGQGGQGQGGGRLLGNFTSEGSLLLPVDSTSVTAVSEGQADTLDGQNMHVYQLTLNPTAVANSDAASLLTAAFGGGGFGREGNAGQATNGQQPPPASGGQQGNNGQPPAGNGGPQGGFGARFDMQNSTINLTVWVGDDNLIHQIQSVVVVTPSANANTDANAPAPTAVTVTRMVDFSHFNEPVTITAPQVAATS